MNKMCSLVSSGVRTDKGSKEVHLNNMVKQLFDFCDTEVSAIQVYNHLKKWRTRWIHVSKPRGLSGASWDHNTCTIVLESNHYSDHIVISSPSPCLIPWT